METLKSAFRSYATGDYETAYFKYRFLSKYYDTNAFEANIKLCEKHIAHLDKSSLQFILRSNGIDAIYVLNLKHRIDRRLKVLREFNKFNLDPIIIEAVDAENSSDVDRRFDKYMSAKSHVGFYTSHIKEEKLRRIKKGIHKGAFGYLMTQKKIFKDAVRKGYNKICVFDDDVFFTENFDKDLVFALDALAGNFKILMLGASEYYLIDNPEFKSQILGAPFYNPIPGRTLGSFGAIYDSSIFNEVLGGIDSNLGTFDNVVLGHLFSKYNNDCYVINPNICIPCVEESDIRKDNREQLNHSMKMNWDVSNFVEYKQDIKYSFILNSAQQVRFVKSLDPSLFNSFSVNFFYFSSDGLRSLIVGHDTPEVKYIVDDLVEVNPNSILQKNKCLDNVPYSDFTIILNNLFELTNDKFINILEDVFKLDGEDKNYTVIQNKGKLGRENLTSIIIPCYRELDRCWPSIKSALDVEGDTEVVVINDNPENLGFEQSLKKMLTKYNFDKNLIIYNHSINRGASAARNTGLWLSNGEYICFLDDDDIYSPTRVINSIGVLDNTEDNLGAVYCGFTGGGHHKDSQERFKDGNLLKEIIALEYLKHYINTDTMTYKRQALTKLGGFNETYKRHQDIELNTRFFKSYNVKAVRSYDVTIRPEKQVPTFKPNYNNILALKKKFISDFRADIGQFDKTEREFIISQHTKDVYKRVLNPTEKDLIDINNQLWELLD